MSKNSEYSFMTVEQLLEEYYYARKEISDYNDGWFVFSNDSKRNKELLQEQYSIMDNVEEEISLRIEKGI